MYNTSPDDLDRVANDLGQIARTYRTASQELEQQVITLEGAVAHVLSGGAIAWKGLSSEAFVSAWLERRARLKQASLLMSEGASYLTMMARTIEENVPLIRAEQSIQLEPIFHSMASGEQQSILDGESQAQNAILMAIAALNSQLESLAEEVSDCPEVDREASYPGYYDNISRNDAGGGAGAQTPEQRIENEVGDPVLAELLIEQANQSGANLEDVAALLENGAGIDQVDQWLQDGVNLKDVATLLNSGVDVTYINAWISKGVDIGSVATFVEGGVNPDVAVQLTRAGVNPDTVLPLIQEGVAPESIINIVKSGVAPENVGNVVESNIANLMEDSNPKLRLTRQNAIGMLNGPPGTYPRVAGRGVQGADVRFVDVKTGEVVLVREEKSLTSAKSFTDELKGLGKQLSIDSAPKELFVQVPRETNANSWIGGFLKENAGSGLSKYKGLEITIVDPEGNVLWEGLLIK